VRTLLIGLILTLAIGFQSTMASFAPTPLDSSKCQASSAQEKMPCCPSGHHSAGCCEDACLIIMAASVNAAATPSVWTGHSDFDRQFEHSAFTSRGVVPLIRPPIL
jgi:hypothetical protein